MDRNSNYFANMTTAQGHATTYYSGGMPIIGGSHDQGLVIKMFKEGDPAASNAIAARETLGPDWATKANAQLSPAFNSHPSQSGEERIP